MRFLNRMYILLQCENFKSFHFSLDVQYYLTNVIMHKTTLEEKHITGNCSIFHKYAS